MKFDELNDDNFLLFAIKYYDNPQCSTKDDFYEDLKRFKYIKRLVNRYVENDELAERLILNHLIVIFNSFGIEASLNMLDLKLDKHHWPVIKPFLIFLNHIKPTDFVDIEMDDKIVQILRKI